MPIPIDPAQLQNCGAFNAPNVSNKLFTCIPPPEGDAYIPMQFKFDQYPGWLVNLGLGTPNQPLSQVAAMYIDATRCSHDVTVLFPDSGYSVRIGLGASQLCPVISSARIPSFYVLLDSSGALSPTDQVSIQLLNRFIPEFGSISTFNRVIIFGTGTDFAQAPFFAPVNTWTKSTSDLVTGLTLIPNAAWYLNEMEINVNLQGGTGNLSSTLALYDAGVKILEFNMTNNNQEYFVGEVCDMGDLNYQSSGTGPLTAAFSSGNPYSSHFGIFNFTGGLLGP